MENSSPAGTAAGTCAGAKVGVAGIVGASPALVAGLADAFELVPGRLAVLAAGVTVAVWAATTSGAANAAHKTRDNSDFMVGFRKYRESIIQ